MGIGSSSGFLLRCPSGTGTIDTAYNLELNKQYLVSEILGG